MRKSCKPHTHISIAIYIVTRCSNSLVIEDIRGPKSFGKALGSRDLVETLISLWANQGHRYRGVQRANSTWGMCRASYVKI